MMPIPISSNFPNNLINSDLILFNGLQTQTSFWTAALAILEGIDPSAMLETAEVVI